jgi:hypothetical protein
MKRLFCRCGQAVYFENHSCNACGRQLSFDPARLEMRAFTEHERAAEGARFCKNRTGDVRCNWLLTDDDGTGNCLSCRTSRIIPSLHKAENRERWRKLEMAKRRLLYGLRVIGLPIDSTQMRFVFKEDRRTNPDVYEEHVTTGHASGEITINAAEADDVFREQMRQTMNEPYRTVLGHFRHECGHYYFNIVVGPDDLPEARSLFGDERLDYSSALQYYYQNGPRAHWQDYYISSYASAHPSEDWAETWAHYLHMSSVVETARAQGLLKDDPDRTWHATFMDIVLAANEIARSLGLADLYPFVQTDTIVRKLEFVRRMIKQRVDATPVPVSA